MKYIQTLSILLLSSCTPTIQESASTIIESKANKVFDIVISNGRVIDPSSQTDAILNVGINGGHIAAISSDQLQGKKTIDATKLVVAPGFIDLHTHTPTAIGTHFQLKDGVTTALELEAGAYPIPKYGGLIKGSAVNHYGASVGYVSIRTKVLEDREVIAFVSEKGIVQPGRAFIHKTTTEELKTIQHLLIQGLNDGGIGIGLPLDYISNAVSEEELRMIFKVAGQRSAPIWVHLRRGVQGDPSGLEEAIALSKEFIVPIHICHINANAMGQIGDWLKRIELANKNGADITIEMYPYTAGSATINSAVFGRDWKNIFGISYEDVQWAATGEYLNKESFDNYRKNDPTGMVIHNYGKEEWLQIALQSPATIIASDAMPLFRLSSKVVPNGIGTFSRILAKYVRDLQLISLPEAIAKMTYLPAKRLEKIAPIFAQKGRIAIGADADIVLFNPALIQDHATYESPFNNSTGMDYVIVAGKIVINNGALEKEVYPGKHLFGSIMTSQKVIAIGEEISHKAIPIDYYEELDKNKAVDPANPFMENIRTRRIADLKNPSAPPPFSDADNQVPKKLESASMPWDDLTTVFKFDWSTLNKDSIDALKSVVKAKKVFNHPDLKIIELAIGAGGILPMHAIAAPSAWHVLEGSAEVLIEGEQAIVHTGTSIKLESWAKRKLTVTSTKPLKVLWFIWAPKGRQDYLNFGYYLTGCNFHAQPIEATMPVNFEFWKSTNRQQHELNNASITTNQQNAKVKNLNELKAALSLSTYNATPLFTSELDINWLDFTKIKGGFFWAKDAENAKELMVPINKVLRMKGIFQAKVPAALYDFNMSYIAFGPHAKYVTHSHATPEFYYILGGETEWILEGEEKIGKAGDVFFHSPYWNHEMKVLKSSEALRAITGSWAPFGDRRVFEQAFVLLEDLPEQKSSAVIGGDFQFHNFDLMEDLEYGKK